MFMFAVIVSILQILSIPLWSDFIYKNPTEEGTVKVSFQSHYGLILSLIWLQEDKGERAFNPTMVWFYLTTNNFFNFSAEHFQSHYGLILSTDKF